MQVFCDLDGSTSMYSVPEHYRSSLRKSFDGVEFLYSGSTKGRSKEVKVYWGNLLTDESVERFPNLQWVHFGSIGVERIYKIRESARKHLIVTNSTGTMTNGIVTHTLYQILYLIRQGQALSCHDDKEIFSRQSYDIVFSKIKNISEVSVLVIGYGSIGRELVRGLNGIAMSVDVASRTRREVEGGRYSYTLSEVKEIAGNYDVVVSVLPYSESLVDIYNREFFRAMRVGAYFINNGRGAHVNEDDLLVAIERGWVGGAALDVCKHEPIDQNHRLVHCRDLLVTPHVAAVDPGYWERECSLFGTNLEWYKRGEYDKMINRVSSR